MGKRLTKIYTRTGDDGTTGLADGSRIDKDSMRMEAIGCVDELNSIIGMVLSHNTPDIISEYLTVIQHDLFDLGGELAIPDYSIMGEQHTLTLEQWLDNLNQDLPSLEEFILPAGGKATACCHLARSVCRHAWVFQPDRRYPMKARHVNVTLASHWSRLFYQAYST